MLRRPGRLRATNIKYEIAQDLCTKPGVVHFGVKLHSPHLALDILDGGRCVWRPGDELEASRQFYRLVTVRHPNRQHLGQTTEEF